MFWIAHSMARVMEESAKQILNTESDIQKEEAGQDAHKVLV